MSARKTQAADGEHMIGFRGPVSQWNRGGMDVDRVAELKRWQDSGAVWEVISRHAGTLTVALLRCDGGEEMDRFTSDDSRLLDFIGDRRSSEA